MKISEYRHYDAMGLAEVLQKGDAKPDELMACALALATSAKQTHNAITFLDPEVATEANKETTLRGVFGATPFLLKDSALASTILPTSLGSRLLDGVKYDHDATLLRRFIDAGLRPFARTTVPEICMAPTTEALRNNGPTLNPFDVRRSSGGSSGGAAVAVALGVVPIAHGSDGGGSIRIPSACCGVFGLKPSRGRLPTGPARGETWAGLATDGVLSRTVRDTAAALDAVSGWASGEPYAAPPQERSFLAAALATEPSERLRVGVLRQAWNSIPVSDECWSSVEHAAILCKEIGHEIADAGLPAVDFDAFICAHTTIMCAQVVVAVDARLKVLGRTLRDDDLEASIWDAYQRGRDLKAPDYVRAIAVMHSTGRAMAAALEQVDVLLTPTITRLPSFLGEFSMNTSFDEFRHKVSRYGTFMSVVNASGQPAASLPLRWTNEGLPVAVQFVGRFGREDTLIQLAAELERRVPWDVHYKSLWAATSVAPNSSSQISPQSDQPVRSR